MKKRKIKVAIFHLGFFFSGGGEKLVIQEILGLKKLGFEVVGYSPVVDKERCFPDLISKVEIKRLFPALPAIFPLRDLIAVLLSCILIPFQFLRFLKFDVLIGANQPGPWLVFVLAKILKKPYLVYLAQPTRLIYRRKIDQETGFWNKSDFLVMDFISRIFRSVISWADKISIKNAKFVLANGEYMTAILEKTYGLKTVNCPAGTNLSNLRNLNFKSRLKGEIKIGRLKIQKPYILLTNRHFPQKRFDYALVTLTFIQNLLPDIKLVITGQDTLYTRYLKFLVGQLGLQNQVIFTRLISEIKLQILYRQAILYVYTSPQEDFGMGILEASAAGTPVVAWDAAGPSKIIRPGKTGFLAKPYLIGDFAQKMLKILSSEKTWLKMSLASRNLIKNGYTFQKHNQIIKEKILESLNEKV